MDIYIKSPDEIEKMRVAGKLASEVLEMIGPHVVVGVSTSELDRICHEYIVNVQKRHPGAPELPWFPEIHLHLA